MLNKKRCKINKKMANCDRLFKENVINMLNFTRLWYKRAL